MTTSSDRPKSPASSHAPSTSAMTAPPRRPRRVAWALLALAVAGGGGALAAWALTREGPAALWDRANDAFHDKHPELAEALLDRLARLRPLTPEQTFFRAQVIGVQGRDDEAAALFRGIPEAEGRAGAELRLIPAPDDADHLPAEGRNLVVVAAVGRVLHFRIFDAEGRRVADTDETRLPARAAAIEGLRAQLKGLWPPARPSRADQDRVIAAVRGIARALSVAPMARLRAGQIERGRDRIRAAEADFLEALRIDPTLVQARRELIYIYGMQLRREAMREQFYKLAELTPPTFHDALLLGLSRNVAWEAAEASGFLARYVQADPTDRASRLALARQLQVLNRYEEAEAALSPLPPADPEVLEIRAQAALNRGDLRGAAALAAQAPADAPDLAFVRARLAAARRDWAAAERHYRSMLAADPHSREALRGLGQALTARGEPAAAKPYLDAARENDRLGNLIGQASIAGASNDLALIHRLGEACLAAGYYPEARIWYRLAIQRDPFDARAQQGLYAAAARQAQASGQ